MEWFRRAAFHGDDVQQIQQLMIDRVDVAGTVISENMVDLSKRAGLIAAFLKVAYLKSLIGMGIVKRNASIRCAQLPGGRLDR
jgi:hypothetical protein